MLRAYRAQVPSGTTRCWSRNTITPLATLQIPADLKGLPSLIPMAYRRATGSCLEPCQYLSHLRRPPTRRLCQRERRHPIAISQRLWLIPIVRAAIRLLSLHHQVKGRRATQDGGNQIVNKALLWFL